MRKMDARQLRRDAAEIGYDRAHPVHVSNGEEAAYRSAKSFMSFTKGLPHDGSDGLVRDEDDPRRLRAAIDAGFTLQFDLNVPLGDRDVPPPNAYRWHFHGDAGPGRAGLDALAPDQQHRRWEAPTAGLVFELQGPDAQAVTMPPAPPLVVQDGHGVAANPELVAEIAEVYWLALLRDVPFAAFDAVSIDGSESAAQQVEQAVSHLGALPFYSDAGPDHPRRRLLGNEALSRQSVFRGHTSGERKGPYLSQFMLMGNRHRGGIHTTEDGYLEYGTLRVDMRVRHVKPCLDHMTHWNEWLDVQNGANVRGIQEQDYVADPAFRFIATPRDLATYVHFDALYEAYLNACLWLLAEGAPVDPQFAGALNRTRHTEGFALFGGPQILSLVTEVATRGLKAVRFQKFNIHLRLRPEALAALVAAQNQGVLPADVASRVAPLAAELAAEHGGIHLLDLVASHNAGQNARHAGYLGDQPEGSIAAVDNLALLPMAFPEGSPMHPSYGAGHATVAGACVTILKAFFDEDACLARETASGAVKAVPAERVTAGGFAPVAFVPSADGSALENKGAGLSQFLRIGDELNKLAANISIGRNMAGVHYYSDYIDSLRLGEAIAIGILQEQSVLYPRDPFRVSLTTFDGHKIIIGDGEVQKVDWVSGVGAVHEAAPSVKPVLPRAAE